MLPLLPALLLLILQGPSSVEKMALEGKLPAALEAIHRRLDANDYSSSELLIQLLALGDPEPNAKPVPHLLEESRDERAPRIVVEPDGAKPTAGFADSQRSRDGPF